MEIHQSLVRRNSWRGCISIHPSATGSRMGKISALPPLEGICERVHQICGRKRIKKYRKEVPEDLEEWFVQNEISLAKEPVNRPRNVALATRLLPLFDKFPEGWAACSYLNEKKSKESKSFSFHLNDWFLSCPHQAQKKFIRKVASQFGILLPFNQISDKDEQKSKP